MGRIEPERALMSSILDRLLDDDPQVNVEAARSSRTQLRELRNSVRRDLENLLNTRRRCVGWPEVLAELENSLLDYGVPDPTSASLSSASAREELLRSIETIIHRFEPRFRSVKVLPVTVADPLDRTLRFRIEAVLYAEPAPEAIAFDSLLEPVTRAFEVKS